MDPITPIGPAMNGMITAAELERQYDWLPEDQVLSAPGVEDAIRQAMPSLSRLLEIASTSAI